MAVDVSVYNEIAKNNNILAQCVANTFSNCYAQGYTNGVSCAVNINNIGQSCQQGVYPSRLACDLIAQPWCCCYWAAIPTLPSVTGGVYVCDASYGQAGGCCAWTVPAGAQFLRFQMWGAGAASKAAISCGISIYGGSGAYASVIIPAVPGCVYTLCAGCGFCCFSYGVDSGTGSGCASYVIGYGLNNVCADGGEVSPYCWMKREKAVNGVDNPDFANICVMLPNSTWACNAINKGIYYGQCMCQYGNFYSNNICVFQGCHPFITSCKTFRGFVTNATQCCHFVIGTPGAWAQLSACGGQSFYMNSPPVTCITCCCSVSCYTSGCIFPGVNCSMCYVYTYPCQRPDNAPGRGGGPSMAYAGSGIYGFPGSGGAVCVQYL
jgi:hypothetical protein